MASKPRTAAGLAAGALVLLTWAHAASRPAAERQPSLRDIAFAREAGEVEAAGTERCMLFHARFGGWQSYLQRSDDFARFCCHLHITEMLAARGGVGKPRVVYRWPISRYDR